MPSEPSGWRDRLGDARVLVSGFGRGGGGLYDVTTGEPEVLDDLPTAGLAIGGGRLWRVLRAPGEQTSTCELLSYDARGVRSYQRYDAIRDPHDVCWFDGAPHVSSSWDDAVWRVDPGQDDPALVWQGSTVPDGWHVNSLVAVDGALLVCAFGRFGRHRAWKDGNDAGRGFVHDVRAGRDVLTGLSHPHTLRWRGGRWYVCESSRGTLTELDAGGTVRRRVAVDRFTRGLAFSGPFALVGGNAHRDEAGDRGEVAVVDVRSFSVVERLVLPCAEAYDILIVGPGVARSVTTGFGTNAARTVEQHLGVDRTAGRRAAAAGAAVRLATPRTAAALAAMGELLDAEAAARCGVRAMLPPVVRAGEMTTWRVEVVNQTDGPLGTVAPRPVKVGARWFRLGPEGTDSPPVAGAAVDPTTDTGTRGGPTTSAGAAEPTTGAGAGDEPIVNPLVPLPRTLPPHMRTAVALPVEVPEQPGRYTVRVALRQPGRGWFGVRAQAEVEVKPDG